MICAKRRFYIMPSRRVALVLSDINSYRLIPGIHRVASTGRDYWMVDFNRPIAEIKSLIHQWKPMGLILEWQPFTTEQLLGMGIPSIVTIGEAEGLQVPCVDVDDARVGEVAASHLLGLGLHQFAFMGESTDYSRQRERAFRQRVETSGHECHTYFQRVGTVRKYIEHWHEAEPELVAWLRDLPKPIGIFAAHDPSGRLLAETCRSLGIRIPEQVAIVGANNDTHVCGMTYPPLSSIEIPWAHIGYETALQMERLLADPASVAAAPLLIAPTKVVPRRSSDFLSVANPTLARALESIHEHATDGLNVSELVRQLRCPRRTLERLFREVLGRSIHEEIMRTRLDTAKELLSRNDLSIDQVAEHSGFSRNERFSVNFRKWEGMTPRDYRKQLRSG
jgi:LacI family transcriptional regulator